MNAIRTMFQLVMGKRLPRTKGTLRVDGLQGEVQVRRDQHGVPYIDATCDDDAWFALGFVHGQDRAGQLEVIVRAVRGTMSAVAGQDTVPVDRLARRVGFKRAGERQVAVADPEIRRQLDVYCLGVNEGMRRGGQGRSHEHALLGCAPTLWEPSDVQGYFALLCFALASNWDMELLRLKILDLDGPDALRALDPGYLATLPVSSPAGLAAGTVDRLSEDIEAFTEAYGLGGGSNAWAIGADRTASGRPILANDPHLNPAMPCAWYLAQIATPDWAVAGATMVGVPAMGSGHNGFAAWGVTAAHADNTDLFLEELGPDARSVREGDHYVSCPVLYESIEVKGGDPILEEVVITPRGPIISPAFEGEQRSISIQATWLAARPYRGFLQAHRARSFESFRELFREGSTSTISFVYADISGDIGWMLSSELPVRRSGLGHLPMPGWSPACGWHDELVPFEDHPYVKNPAEGFVATANNQPLADGVGPFMGVDWLDGFRQAAIVGSLASRDDWTVSMVAALQRDVRSLPWERVRERVLELDTSTLATAQQAQSILRDWDGQMSPDSVGATVYAFFFASFCRRIVDAKAPGASAWALGRGFTALLPYNLIVTRRLAFFVRLIEEQPDTGYVASWARLLLACLADAVENLSARFGEDTQRWSWGEVRPLTLVHTFAAQAPMDALFNVGPIPYGGDAGTIAQASIDLTDPSANPVGVATLRQVIDVGRWEACRYILVHGQSGNPYSPHFSDQTETYLHGEGIPIWYAHDHILEHTKAHLRLKPR